MEPDTNGVDAVIHVATAMSSDNVENLINKDEDYIQIHKIMMPELCHKKNLPDANNLISYCVRDKNSHSIVGVVFSTDMSMKGEYEIGKE